jgi:hypothetical protein
LRRRLGGLGSSGVILQAAGQALLAAGGMGVAVWLWLAWGAGLPAGLPVWLQALGGAALGGLAYGALVFALRVPEAMALFQAVLRRIRPIPPAPLP